MAAIIQCSLPDRRLRTLTRSALSLLRPFARHSHRSSRYCNATTSACHCSVGWTGMQCNKEHSVMLPAVGVSQSATIVVPAQCPHAVSKSTGLGLKICAGKLSRHICVDPSKSAAARADADVGAAITQSARLGRACTHALSMFYCNNVFPAADVKTGSILPANFTECVRGLEDCLSHAEATKRCTAAGPSRHGAFAAVAAWDSRGTTALTPKKSARVSPDGTPLPLERHHSSCTATKSGAVLTGCPHRAGFRNYIDHHIFASVKHADDYVVAELAKYASASGSNTSSMCLAARRDQLCSVHMPVCDLDECKEGAATSDDEGCSDESKLDDDGLRVEKKRRCMQELSRRTS